MATITVTGLTDEIVTVKEIFASIEPLLEKQRERQRAAHIPDKPGWVIIREDRDSDHGRLYDPWGRGTSLADFAPQQS